MGSARIKKHHGICHSSQNGFGIEIQSHKGTSVVHVMRSLVKSTRSAVGERYVHLSIYMIYRLKKG